MSHFPGYVSRVPSREPIEKNPRGKWGTVRRALEPPLGPPSAILCFLGSTAPLRGIPETGDRAPTDTSPTSTVDDTPNVPGPTPVSLLSY